MANDYVVPPLAALKPPNSGDLRDHQEQSREIGRADPLGNLAVQFGGARAKSNFRGPFLSAVLFALDRRIFLLGDRH